MHYTLPKQDTGDYQSDPSRCEFNEVKQHLGFLPGVPAWN